MKKFEYLKYKAYTCNLDKLKELGEKGWELCCSENFNKLENIYYFKKEIEENNIKQLKCFIKTDKKDICFKDFKNEEKTFGININQIAYKSDIETFNINLSNDKVVYEKYFYIELINETRFYCKENQFNNI